MKVDPKKLVMTGIGVGENDSIEEGYHLRWFGRNLELPESAFPNMDFIYRFFKDPKNGLHFFEESKDVYNPVPPAFEIYRRRHHINLDIVNEVYLSSSLFRSLLKGKKRSINLGGTIVSVKRNRIKARNWIAVILEHFFNMLEILLTFLLPPSLYNFLKNIIWSEPVIVIKFPATVHFLTVEGISLKKPRILMSLFADDDPEPIRSENLYWGEGGFFTRRIKKVEIDQGHYDKIHINTHTIPSLKITFIKMSDDTSIASDPENSQPHEWIPIRTIPFITLFQFWDGAKSHHFDHEIKNRYLEFQDTDSQLSNDAKLDLKYGVVFSRLQMAFIALHLKNTVEGCRFLNQSPYNNFPDIDYDAEAIFNILSIDPINATLLGFKYTDTARDQNQLNPITGITYDYMVATKWQSRQQDRICYITLNVLATDDEPKKITPEIYPPQNLHGKQEEGLSWHGRTSLYRSGLYWDKPEAPEGKYKAYDVVGYDIYRSEVESQNGKCITLYFDDSATDDEQKVIDKPVILSSTHSLPGIEKERSHYTGTQLLGLEIDKAIKERNTSFLLTAEHYLALQAMKSEGRMQFFGTDNKNIEFSTPLFNEWLPIIDTKRTVYYKNRAFDIFGRTSGLNSNKCEVVLTRLYPPPEIINLSAFFIDEDKKNLQVTWSVNGYQQYTGERINHFNIVNREIPAEDKVRSFDPENNEPESDWRKFGNEWKDRILNSSPVSFTPPYDVKVIDDIKPLNGAVIAGVIKNVQSTTSNIIIPGEGNSNEEIESSDYESKLVNGSILIVTTDQAFLGLSPFVDIVERFRQRPGGITPPDIDTLKLRIRDEIYSVIGFEQGKSLRLMIDFPYDARIYKSPEDHFSSIYRGNVEFELLFEQVKDEFEFNLDIKFDHIIAKNANIAENINEVYSTATPVDDKLRLIFEEIDANASLSSIEKKQEKEIESTKYILSNRRTISLEVLLDITGRENWFTKGAVFEYQYPGEEGKIFRLPVNDIEVEIDKDKPIHRGPQNERSFLREITIESIVQDGIDRENYLNPIPIFPYEMIERLVKGETISILVKIKRAPIFLIAVETQVVLPEKLMLSKGGYLSYLDDDNNLIICEVITRPFPIDTRYKCSFFVRGMQVVSSSRANNYFGIDYAFPGINKECQFLPVYSLLIENLRSKFTGRDTEPILINLAVSTHRIPAPGNGYPAEELANLVSVPVEVQIPPLKPALPATFQFSQTGDAFVDPFVDVFASLPKILDNKKVVQYEIDFTSAELMKETTLPQPSENIIYEVFRAPEQGLIIAQSKMESSADDAVLTFLRKTRDEIRQSVITSLIDNWDNATDSFKNSFSLVARINSTKFIDQIEAAASGRYYYAVRAYSEGAPPSDLSLLPFRVNIPDRRPPAAPNFRVERKEDIFWKPNREPDIYCYEVYRADNFADSDDIRRMSRIGKLFLNQADLDTVPAAEADISGLACHAPLMLKSMTRRLSVKRPDANPGKIDLIFGISSVGIAAENKIRGVYKDNSGDSDVPDEESLGEFDFGNETTDSANLLIGGAALSGDGRSIINVVLNHKDRAAVIFEDDEGNIRIMRSINYHSIDLSGIPSDKLGSINGIYPRKKLEVKGKRISLIFEPAVHGILSIDSIP